MPLDPIGTPFPPIRSSASAELFKLPHRPQLSKASKVSKVSNAPPSLSMHAVTQRNDHRVGHSLVAMLRAQRLIGSGTPGACRALNMAIGCAAHAGHAGGAAQYVREALTLLRASSASDSEAVPHLEAACSPIPGNVGSAERTGAEALAGMICAKLIKLKDSLYPHSHGTASSAVAGIIDTADTLVHRLTECESKDQIQHLLARSADMLDSGAVPASDARTRLGHELRVALADCRTFNAERAGALLRAAHNLPNLLGREHGAQNIEQKMEMIMSVRNPRPLLPDRVPPSAGLLNLLRSRAPLGAIAGVDPVVPAKVEADSNAERHARNSLAPLGPERPPCQQN